MRKATFLLLVGVLIALGIFMSDRVLAQEVQVETGFHFDWWDSPGGDWGQQYYVPLIARVNYKDFAFRVVGGRAYTAANQSDGANASTAAFLDTKLNLSYQIVEKWPIDMLFAIDFNLPTGLRNLTQEELMMVMDPDLVSIINFGEGFNINPSIILSRQWGEKWFTGVGIGYNVRSRYMYSTEVMDYRPGDAFSVVPEVRYDFADHWESRLFGNFTTTSMSKTYEVDFVKQGDFFLIGAGLSYIRSEWDAGLNVSGIIRLDDQWYQNPYQDGPLTYSFSQGNEIITDLSLKYSLDEDTRISSLARFLWMSGNDEPPRSAFYWGQRQYFSLQLGVARRLTPHLELECAFKGFTMHDGPNWNHRGQDKSFRGGAANIKLTGFF